MLLPSRSGRGHPCGHLKSELVEGGTSLSVEDARTEIFDYIEIYCTGGPVQSGAEAFIAGLQKP
ncbi:IS3 family transposase [Spirosoma flavum]|uniref:IS3 family transposase n=1 Tax=Spirosoma flavum TaxID=2048557 RepID=A0ABW6ATN8_9BACT